MVKNLALAAFFYSLHFGAGLSAKETEIEFGLFQSSAGNPVITRAGHKGNFADHLKKRIQEKGPITQDVRAKVRVWSDVSYKEMLGMFALFRAAGVKKFEVIATYEGKEVSFKTNDPLRVEPSNFNDGKSVEHLFVVGKEQAKLKFLRKFNFDKIMV